jgi:hypothetical protein
VLSGAYPPFSMSNIKSLLVSVGGHFLVIPTSSTFRISGIPINKLCLYNLPSVCAFLIALTHHCEPAFIIIAAKHGNVGCLKTVVLHESSILVQHISNVCTTMDYENHTVEFHCLSTKQKFRTDNPQIVKTTHGRYFYVAASPFRTHSVKTGKELGKMYRAVPKHHLEYINSQKSE